VSGKGVIVPTISFSSEVPADEFPEFLKQVREILGLLPSKFGKFTAVLKFDQGRRGRDQLWCEIAFRGQFIVAVRPNWIWSDLEYADVREMIKRRVFRQDEVELIWELNNFRSYRHYKVCSNIPMAILRRLEGIHERNLEAIRPSEALLPRLREAIEELDVTDVI